MTFLLGWQHKVTKEYKYLLLQDIFKIEIESKLKYQFELICFVFFFISP